MPITPGSLVFGDTLFLEFINPHGNATIPVDTWQNGTPAGIPSLWLNESYSVAAGVNVLTFTLPSSSVTLPTRLCVDGGCMEFLHLTPITLLPSGVLNVGGLDILAFGITAETLLLMVPLTLWARSIARRALWVPTIRWWLVLPHVATGSLLLVSAEFPALDQLFSGLEFVLFPIPIGLLFFFWVMHLFNVAVPGEAFRPDPRDWHDLDFYRWRLVVGDLPDGRKVLIDPRWRGVFARLRNHAPVILDPAKLKDGKTPVPVSAKVLTLRSESVDEKRDRVWKEYRRFRSRPDRPTPFDSFKVVNASLQEYREKDPPRLLWWVDSDQWLQVRFPYVTWHRDVQVPAVVDREGRTVQPARIKRKLTWPHYVDPPAVVALSGIHWKDVVAAGLDWVKQERAYQLVERLRRENYLLRATVYVLSDEKSARSMDETFTWFDRERFPISVAEAQEEAKKPEKDDDVELDEPDRHRGPEAPTSRPTDLED